MFDTINSKYAPKALGLYPQAVKLGDFVYLSGMIPVNPETNEVVEGGIAEQTKMIMLNIGNVLNEMNLEHRHILKTTIFMTDLNDFDQMNTEYAKFFDGKYPARSCVEVKALPKGVNIEIECMVIDTLVYEYQMQQQAEGGCGCGGCSDTSSCGDGGCGSGCCG